MTGNKTFAIFLTTAILLLAIIPAVPAQTQTIENKLVILSPISKTSIDAVAKPFAALMKAKYGVDVTVDQISGSSPETYARVLEWKGKPDADIYWGGEYQVYPDLTLKNLMAGYASMALDAVPADFQGFPLKDSNGKWVVVSFFSPGIMTNKDALARLKAPEPKTWDDLLNPIYRGTITMTTPGRSGGLHIDTELLLQSRGEDKGWAYWRRLAVNVGKWAGRSLEVSSAVEKGEFALGIAIAETSAVLSKKAGFNVGFVYPDPSFFSPSPIGILAGVQRPNVAKEFMDYILSKDGQVNALKGGLVPASKDLKLSDYASIPDAAILKDFLKAENVYGVQIKNFRMDYTAYANRFSDVNNKFEDTISKQLKQLVGAWEKIESSQKSLETFTKQVQDAKAQGYDINQAQTQLDKAQAGITGALGAFDSGDYDKATSLATQAGTDAEGAIKLLKAPEPVRYDLYAAAAIAILVVAALLVYRFRSRPKNKES